MPAAGCAHDTKAPPARFRVPCRATDAIVAVSRGDWSLTDTDLIGSQFGAIEEIERVRDFLKA